MSGARRFGHSSARLLIKSVVCQSDACRFGRSSARLLIRSVVYKIGYMSGWLLVRLVIFQVDCMMLGRSLVRLVIHRVGCSSEVTCQAGCLKGRLLVRSVACKVGRL